MKQVMILSIIFFQLTGHFELEVWILPKMVQKQATKLKLVV